MINCICRSGGIRINTGQTGTFIENESRWIMMPLSMAETGRMNRIRKVGGKDETRRFLESLGFVVGGFVTVVSEMNGNLIVNVKESRVAISKEMANKIMV